MSYYEFTSVFQKISPKGSNLVHLKLILSLKVQSEISRFWTHARAGEVTLEREMRVSSTFIRFTVCSSGGMHARARVCVIRSSGGRAPVEREFHASSTFS